jgi:hypothetical protein
MCIVAQVKILARMFFPVFQGIASAKDCLSFVKFSQSGRTSLGFNNSPEIIIQGKLVNKLNCAMKTVNI